MSLASFILSSSRLLTSSPLKTGLASIVSRFSAPFYNAGTSVFCRFILEFEVFVQSPDHRNGSGHRTGSFQPGISAVIRQLGFVENDCGIDISIFYRSVIGNNEFNNDGPPVVLNFSEVRSVDNFSGSMEISVRKYIPMWCCVLHDPQKQIPYSRSNPHRRPQQESLFHPMAG